MFLEYFYDATKLSQSWAIKFDLSMENAGVGARQRAGTLERVVKYGEAALQKAFGLSGTKFQ